MYYPEVWSPTEAHGVDLLIVSLKYCALKDTLKSIQTIVDDHTIVMSLMNGVDSEEIIGEAIGKEHLMPSLNNYWNCFWRITSTLSKQTCTINRIII